MTTRTAPTVIELIPLDEIDPNPYQPRRFKDDSARINELAESIRRHGVRQAVLLRPVGGDGRFQLVFGERRVRACRLLGLDRVPAVVDFLMDDDEAFRLCAAENLQREDLDPLEEASVYKACQDRGWTLEDIAAEFGCTARHAARRARLADLVDEWRQAVAEPGGKFAEWGPAHLELVARFSPERQRELLKAARKKYNLRTPLDVRYWLAMEYHILDKAPWKLDDALLCPKAGACLGCQRRSDVHPELFDEVDWSPYQHLNAKVEEGARCLDAACWKKKADAYVAQRVKALQDKHEDLHCITGYSMVAAKGLPTIEYYDAKDAKKGTPGAVPAVQIRDGQVTLRWVKRPDAKPGNGSTGSRNGAGGASKASPQEEAEQRRKAWVCTRVAEEVEALLKAGLPTEVCTAREALALVSAFGYEAPYSGAGSDWEVYHKAREKGEAELARGAVEQVLRYAAENFGLPSIWQVLQAYDEAREVCIFLGVNLKAIEAEALREIPDPAAKPGKPDPAVPAVPANGKGKKGDNASEPARLAEPDELAPVKKPKAGKGKKASKAEDVNPATGNVTALQAFHDATHYFDWSDRNCDGCAKSCRGENLPESPCSIETAIMGAYRKDPDLVMVPTEIADRMGSSERDIAKAPLWDCPEKLPLSDAEPEPAIPAGKGKKAATGAGGKKAR